MEVYLSQDPDFRIFLPNKAYHTWTSFEINPHRIPALKDGDILEANNDNSQGEIITADEAIAANEEKLDSIRTNLRTVLSIMKLSWLYSQLYLARPPARESTF